MTVHCNSAPHAELCQKGALRINRTRKSEARSIFTEIPESRSGVSIATPPAPPSPRSACSCLKHQKPVFFTQAGKKTKAPNTPATPTPPTTTPPHPHPTHPHPPPPTPTPPPASRCSPPPRRPQSPPPPRRPHRSRGPGALRLTRLTR